MSWRPVARVAAFERFPRQHLYVRREWDCDYTVTAWWPLALVWRPLYLLRRWFIFGWSKATRFDRQDAQLRQAVREARRQGAAHEFARISASFAAYRDLVRAEAKRQDKPLALDLLDGVFEGLARTGALDPDKVGR